MKRASLIAVAITAAAPCAALAQSASGAAGASSGGIDARTTQPQTRIEKQGAASPSAALFERLDKNKDGFVTRDEARDATELQGRFAELDQDNDGKISRDEMRALDADRSAAGRTKAKQ